MRNHRELKYFAKGGEAGEFSLWDETNTTNEPINGLFGSRRDRALQSGSNTISRRILYVLLCNIESLSKLTEKYELAQETTKMWVAKTKPDGIVAKLTTTSRPKRQKVRPRPRPGAASAAAPVAQEAAADTPPDAPFPPPPPSTSLVVFVGICAELAQAFEHSDGKFTAPVFAAAAAGVGIGVHLHKKVINEWQNALVDEMWDDIPFGALHVEFDDNKVLDFATSLKQARDVEGAPHAADTVLFSCSWTRGIAGKHKF